MRKHSKGLIVVALGAAMTLAACSTDGSVDPSAAPENTEAAPVETEETEAPAEVPPAPGAAEDAE